MLELLARARGTCPSWLDRAEREAQNGATMEHIESQSAPKEAAKRLIALIERQHVLPQDVDPREAMAAVLCVLTQRLSARETQRIFSALPAAIRCMFDACILHRDDPPAVFALDEFLRRVADHLEVTAHTARRIIRAVFTAVRMHLADHQIEAVNDQLPADVRALWSPDVG
jgi:uncharacterized protein (DUF2267 family)